MQLRVHQNGKRSELHRNSFVFIFQGNKSNALCDSLADSNALLFSFPSAKSVYCTVLSIEVNRSSRPGRM
jgi:hypothetical protein